jgi:hypothetical protein
MPAFADYGILTLSYLFFQRTDSNGNYITPVRHAEGSVSFGTNPTTITDYLTIYSNVIGYTDYITGYVMPMWYNFLLLFFCSVSRLIDGTTTFGNLWTMQCYDNFIADIYLEQPEGIYAELDMFTWRGFAIAYGAMTVNAAISSIVGTTFNNFVTYIIYLAKMGTMPYGAYTFMMPVYDYGWFGGSGLSLTL